jgi:hypothetical protein
MEMETQVLARVATSWRRRKNPKRKRRSEDSLEARSEHGTGILLQQVERQPYIPNHDIFQEKLSDRNPAAIFAACYKEARTWKKNLTKEIVAVRKREKDRARSDRRGNLLHLACSRRFWSVLLHGLGDLGQVIDADSVEWFIDLRQIHPVWWM